MYKLLYFNIQFNFQFFFKYGEVGTIKRIISVPARWMDSKKVEEPIFGYGLFFGPIGGQNTNCITFLIPHMAKLDSFVAYSAHS